MKLVDIPLELLRPAPWNANSMDEQRLSKLDKSLTRFGFVQNLVVRPLGDGMYEVIAGNQRLEVLKRQGAVSAPCYPMDLDDAHARFLSQAMNLIHGEDDLGLRAELVRQVLAQIPSEDVTALLPETSESLRAITSLGTADLASGLAEWQAKQLARLKHLTFQVTDEQQDIVEAALNKVAVAGVKQPNRNPNARGIALYEICKRFLEVHHL